MKDFGEQAYFVNIPSKFISPDGKTAWLLYSANFAPDWNGMKLDINPPGGHYGLVLQKIELLAGQGSMMRSQIAECSVLRRPTEMIRHSYSDCLHRRCCQQQIRSRRIHTWQIARPPFPRHTSSPSRSAKSSPYTSPTSNERLHWDGNLQLEGGTLVWIDKLLYAPTEWEKGWSGCSREYRHRLEKPEWKSEIIPGSGNGTEGIRFAFEGTPDTRVTIATQARTISFPLNELIEKEMLEFHCGAHYSGQPIVVFLGQDGRIRVSRKQYITSLNREQRAGAIVLPDDFAGEQNAFHEHILRGGARFRGIPGGLWYSQLLQASRRYHSAARAADGRAGRTGEARSGR